MKIACHPSRNVDLHHYWELSRIGKCRFSDLAAPVTVPSSLLLFQICIGNNKIPSVLSDICDSLLNLLWMTLLLLMWILTKSAPNLASSHVFQGFGSAIFQTVDVLVCYLLSDWKQKTDWQYATQKQLNVK